MIMTNKRKLKRFRRFQKGTQTRDTNIYTNFIKEAKKNPYILDMLVAEHSMRAPAILHQEHIQDVIAKLDEKLKRYIW